MTLNCKISHKLEDLEMLNKVYPWVPGKENIRPTMETILKKQDYLNNVRHFYATEEDCILEMIFKFPTKFDSNGKLVITEESLTKKITVFTENVFPYKLPTGTKHWVLWYSYIPENITEIIINQEIHKNLLKERGKEDFEFCWYENPKRTLKSGFHVQVFWHEIEEKKK